MIENYIIIIDKPQTYTLINKINNPHTAALTRSFTYILGILSGYILRILFIQFTTSRG